MSDKQHRERMRNEPAFWRQNIKLEVSGHAAWYADVQDDWQEDYSLRMDGQWLYSAGIQQEFVGPMWSWRELCRGAAKTWGLAARMAWALEFAPQRSNYGWYASDTDQGRRAIEEITKHIELNPWHTLTIQRNTVTNPTTGSTLQINSADVASGYGALYSGIAIDEIGNWANTPSAERQWQMIASTAIKKKNCVMEVITNAGNMTHWQYPLMTAVKEDAAGPNPNWYFESVRKRPSWYTDDAWEAQRRMLPSPTFARLFEVQWTPESSTGVSATDLDAVTMLLGELDRRTNAYDCFVCATDLGWRHDRSSNVVVARHLATGQIHVLYANSLSPADYGGELPLRVVEDELLDIHRRFNLDQLVFDPREAVGLSQRLADRGMPCGRMNLGPETQDKMAKTFLQAFNQRWVRLYEHAELARDILSMEVVDRVVGLKLQAARTSGGHSDMGFAFAMALLAVREFEPQQTEGEVLFA